MENLYGILAYDDPYCAEYTLTIFTNFQQAIEYLRLHIIEKDLACVEEWKFVPEEDRYLSRERYYLLDEKILTNNEYWDKINKMKAKRKQKERKVDYDNNTNNKKEI